MHTIPNHYVLLACSYLFIVVCFWCYGWQQQLQYTCSRPVQKPQLHGQLPRLLFHLAGVTILQFANPPESLSDHV